MMNVQHRRAALQSLDEASIHTVAQRCDYGRGAHTGGIDAEEDRV